jgi:hypothetical protein
VVVGRSPLAAVLIAARTEAVVLVALDFPRAAPAPIMIGPSALHLPRARVVEDRSGEPACIRSTHRQSQLAEWMFALNCSVKAEGLEYDLGDYSDAGAL